ncbi:DUF736 family protein [Novosphingobium sp. AP12]|uniref:DUF736 family protein n=1 Tax=Novosphingobium sp. AP12 TaxID=1144305 RepID=UPI001EE6430F|nr:DUF736 family protein [Novosphingobium sp. AP12]
MRVGALFEPASRETGLVFYNSEIEDPNFTQPPDVSVLQRQDGAYNVVWSRPSCRRELPSEMAPPTDQALPPRPREEASAAAPLVRPRQAPAQEASPPRRSPGSDGSARLKLPTALSRTDAAPPGRAHLAIANRV